MAEKAPAKIFIATPCYGGMVTQEYMQSILACSSVSHTPLTLSLLGDDALVTRARNTLLHKFYTLSDATHILFIDADIGFPAEAPEKLLSRDKDIVAGMYPLRQRIWDEKTMENMRRGESEKTASLRYVGECPAMHKDASSGPLFKSIYAGTGFMLIKRRVIDLMIKNYPETAYKHIHAPGDDEKNYTAYALFDGAIDPKSKTYLSEDFAFCSRWKDMGGDIWLDTSIELSHHSGGEFKGDPSLRKGMLFRGQK